MLSVISKKVSKGAKIRNRYNQIPHHSNAYISYNSSLYGIRLSWNTNK